MRDASLSIKAAKSNIKPEVERTKAKAYCLVSEVVASGNNGDTIPTSKLN